MNLVSIPLFIQKNWLVVESDVPFYIAFNAKAPNALKNGKIMADELEAGRTPRNPLGISILLV